ncbi:DNA polymerase III subunit delta [Dehalogenimonas etheniformans]|uniref:DNA-directed DNA polymerase n=1 Tax=Dehalogenimonas etheniformans TaxID=1536648 RepID=A0A2P5P757_9CHLR|nr:DNA polymerase III subunit delta [Dehalogenimonas etheniformans]PPD58138.1 DNA polymerase III subunit delta [Dehalogenimonas etheniformans]QNT75545.1 DNA polymerase III subunit delta [Dehalogenimonas etheniformans]
MRYLLAGPDDFSLKLKLASIKASLGDPAVLASATSVFEGAKLKPGEFKLTVDALPFLTPCRLVVVTGLLARFSAGDGTLKKASKIDDPEVFASAITNSPPSTAIILIETELSRNNPLFKYLADKVEVHEFPMLDKPRLKEWIGRRVMDAGGAITPMAINLLVQYVGADLWAVAGEIEKLVLFAAGRPITDNDVKTLVGYAGESNIFALVDAIFETRLKTATETLENLKVKGLSASYVLSMLSRQLRLVIQYKELKSRGSKDLEIRRKLGLLADFVWKKTQDQAARFTMSRLKDVYSRLLEADLAAKTGRMDEELALDLLVAELASGAPLTPVLT